MEKLALSLYSGSLFLILSSVAPVLLRTEKHKEIGGHFYGRILRRFYGVAFFLLTVYFIMGDKFWAVVLLAGLGLNVYISVRLREYKRTLGNIEQYPFDSPQRRKFRHLSYLSTAVLSLNFLLSAIILLREVV